jgi:hypothetical protein
MRKKGKMIRQATYDDIPELMEIFRCARQIMRASGNMNQWNDSYPTEEVVREDIARGVCFVLSELQHEPLPCHPEPLPCHPEPLPCHPERSEGSVHAHASILATMAFIPGPDPTYARIYDGHWLDDSPYYVIHRIAVREPGHKAADRLLEWAFTQTGNIRIDTHKDNVIMHHILQKHGFTHCGVIHLLNGAPREAFQKNQCTTRCTQSIEHQHVK